MDGFLSWVFVFMTTMIQGVWRIFSNLYLGIVQIFNFPVYIDQIQQHKSSFGAIDWILCIITLILSFALWALIIFMIALVIRKYVRFRRSLVGNEDLLEEIAELHRDVIQLTKEKERILSLKVGQTGVAIDQLKDIYSGGDDIGKYNLPDDIIETAPSEALKFNDSEKTKTSSDKSADDKNTRFLRLSTVDEKYEFYTAPEYVRDMSLAQICDDVRNFACTKMRLYYDIKTIRLMFAGLASTKLILLQGISGTGKTSLPYMLGKYFENDATIASVQPSWRDRTELFGYFNEFTKKFNETEVLKRIYEASYNDDLNIIVLDEMNIARVEYYFAEMLSILEMPDPREWKIELVPSSWPGDPRHLKDGKLNISQNIWYIGTANNDDSTFAVSDKVYDRALVINLDSKGVAFDAPATDSKRISYTYIEKLYDRAFAEYPISKSNIDKIHKLDLYVIEKFRVAFGNRIINQLHHFVPVYVAAGGTETEGIDYILATKILRKFESLNLSLIRDEIKGLINFLNVNFGMNTMNECIAFLERLQKMY